MSQQVSPKVQAARDEQVQAAQRMDALDEYIPSIIAKIGRVWPDVAGKFDGDRFAASTIQALQRQPKLIGYEGDAFSLLGALRQCAEYGLYPDVERGHVALIPRWHRDTMLWRTTFQMGYKGMIYLFRRNPVSAPGNPVQSERVFENELKDLIYIKGLEPRLEHHPNLTDSVKDRKLALVYTILRYADGSFEFDHVLNEQIQEIRANHSDAKNSAFSPWNSDTDLVVARMEKKTSMKQVLILSPALDDALASAVALDDLADAGVDQRLVGKLDKTLRDIGGKLLSSGKTSVPVTTTPSNGEEKLTNGAVAGNSLKGLMDAKRQAAADKLKADTEAAAQPQNEVDQPQEEVEPKAEAKADETTQTKQESREVAVPGPGADVDVKADKPKTGKDKPKKGTKKKGTKTAKPVDPDAAEASKAENPEGLPFKEVEQPEPESGEAFQAMMDRDGADAEVPSPEN